MPRALRMRLVDSPGRLARRAQALGELRGVSLAGAAHHGAADLLALADTDLVLVAVHTDGFDRCSGLLDVARLSLVLPPERIVAIADHRVGPVVRLRARQSGAGALLEGGPPTVAALRDAIAGDGGREVDRTALAALGLRPTSRPAAALQLIADRRLEAAFDAPPVLAASGLSRRRAITVRQELSRAVGIELTDTGSGAVIERKLPSWRQVHAVVSAARGADPRDL